MGNQKPLPRLLLLASYILNGQKSVNLKVDFLAPRTCACVFAPPSTQTFHAFAKFAHWGNDRVVLDEDGRPTAIGIHLQNAATHKNPAAVLAGAGAGRGTDAFGFGLLGEQAANNHSPVTELAKVHAAAATLASLTGVPEESLVVPSLNDLQQTHTRAHTYTYADGTEPHRHDSDENRQESRKEKSDVSGNGGKTKGENRENRENRSTSTFLACVMVPDDFEPSAGEENELLIGRRHPGFYATSDCKSSGGYDPARSWTQAFIMSKQLAGLQPPFEKSIHPDWWEIYTPQGPTRDYWRNLFDGKLASSNIGFRVLPKVP